MTTDAKDGFQGAVAAKTPLAFFHVDMDGLDAIYRHRGYEYRGSDGGFYRTAVENSLEFFASLDLRATYFFIAKDLDDAERRRALGEIVKNGHAAGSHGVSHQRLSTLDEKRRRAEIFDSKKRIEDATGKACPGFRAPSYDMDRKCLELCRDAGYVYDSSLFSSDPLLRQMQGPAGPAGARGIFADTDFYELPVGRISGLLPPFHPCYSFYLTRFYFQLGLAIHRRRFDFFTLLFHMTDFCSKVELTQNFQQRFFTNDFYSLKQKKGFLRALVGQVGNHYRFALSEDIFYSES